AGAADELLGVAAGVGEADEAGARAEGLAAAAAEAALAAGREQERHHAVADPPALDAVAQLRDPADHLEAEHEREVDGEARRALADVHVEVVERAGEHVDEHLSRPGPRRLHFLQPEDVGPAELVEHDRLHPPTSPFRRPSLPLCLTFGALSSGLRSEAV